MGTLLTPNHLNPSLSFSINIKYFCVFGQYCQKSQSMEGLARKTAGKSIFLLCIPADSHVYGISTKLFYCFVSILLYMPHFICLANCVHFIFGLISHWWKNTSVFVSSSCPWFKKSFLWYV